MTPIRAVIASPTSHGQEAARTQPVVQADHLDPSVEPRDGVIDDVLDRVTAVTDGGIAPAVC